MGLQDLVDLGDDPGEAYVSAPVGAVEAAVEDFVPEGEFGEVFSPSAIYHPTRG